MFNSKVIESIFFQNSVSFPIYYKAYPETSPQCHHFPVSMAEWPCSHCSDILISLKQLASQGDLCQSKYPSLYGQMLILVLKGSSNVWSKEWIQMWYLVRKWPVALTASRNVLELSPHFFVQCSSPSFSSLTVILTSDLGPLCSSFCLEQTSWLPLRGLAPLH